MTPEQIKSRVSEAVTVCSLCLNESRDIGVFNDQEEAFVSIRVTRNL